MTEGFDFKLICLIVILSEVRNVSDERSRMYLVGLISSLCSIDMYGFSTARSFDYGLR